MRTFHREESRRCRHRICSKIDTPTTLNVPLEGHGRFVGVIEVLETRGALFHLRGAKQRSVSRLISACISFPFRVSIGPAAPTGHVLTHNPRTEGRMMCAGTKLGALSPFATRMSHVSQLQVAAPSTPPGHPLRYPFGR